MYAEAILCDAYIVLVRPHSLATFIGSLLMFVLVRRCFYAKFM